MDTDKVPPTRKVPVMTGETVFPTEVTIPREGDTTARNPCEVEAVT